MKVLAVYDSPCIPKPFLLRDVKEWHWFSLTSGSGPLDLSLREIMHQEGRVKCLPSARLIDESFEKIANRVTGWSASFGQRKVAGRSLIDWFTLSNGQTSSWWFSLVSEKNHLQTDVFFRLAQLDALSDVLKSGGYDCLWVALEDPRMGLALRRMSKKKNVLFIPNRPARTKDGKERFRQWIVSLGCGGAMLLGGLWLFRFLTESVIARHVLGPWRKRFPPSPGPLIVAPFPMLDPWAAEEGRFVSKLFGPLHEELRRRGPLQWLFISVPYEGSTFFNSARMARRFSSPSETSYFLQEFASLLLMIKIFWLWGRQIFRAIWLNYWLPWRLIAQEISAAEGDVFLRGLWWQSFVGNVGIAGLVRFEIFKKALSFLGKRSTFCLHSAEMQAWEKALNAASERVCPELFRIGYQNTAISRRQLAFFYEPWEINPSSKGRGLPLPNVIACNGTEANRLLLTCCYPRVEQVEALRYLHLSDVLGKGSCSISIEAFVCLGRGIH
jgi:surface carbohydrate biosynthesis protein (TIGR04326 family)